MAPHLREPAVSPHVSALIMKMMAKDPAQRQQNATQLRADIERCKNSQMPLPAHAAAKPAKAAAAAPAGTPAAAAALPAVPAPPLLDRIFGAADKVFPFVPAPARLPALAVSCTVVLLVVLWLLTAIVRG